MVAAGSTGYAVGSTLSTIGGFTKFFASHGETSYAVSAIMELPGISLTSPGAQIIGNETLSYYVNKSLKDPCS